MALPYGNHWQPPDITTPTNGWLPRLTTNIPTFGSAYPNPSTRLLSAKNTWVADKAADQYRNVFTGSATTPVPQDQSGQYDPLNAGDGLLAAAFWGMVMSYSSNPTTAAAGRAVQQAVIAELFAGYIDKTHSVGGNNVKSFDWDLKQRWVPGGMSDVNPTFPFAEWIKRMLNVYSYVKAEATEAQKAKIEYWLLGAGNLIHSWCKKDLDTHFVSRTGEPGTYTLKASYTSSVLNTGQSKAHYFGWRCNKVAAYRNNRRRVMMMTVGSIGLFLGNTTLLDAGIRYYQEHFAYAVAPDQTFVDFQRSKDKTSTGLIKAYQGYSYSIPVPLYIFAYECLLNGIDPNRVIDFSTNKGLTSSQAGDGATSDGSTQKNLLSTTKKLNEIWAGTANFYSPADSTKRISKTDLTGKINGQHTMQFIANLWWQDSSIYNFLTTNVPASNVQPVGPTKWYLNGNVPDLMVMFGLYGNVPTRDRFAVEEVPDDPGVEKVAVVINFPDQADRAFVLNQLITFTATVVKASDNSSTGVSPTVFIADAAGIVVQDSQTPGQLVVKVTGANAIFRVGASFAGNDNYLEATTKYNYVKISKAVQTVDAPTIPEQTFPGSFSFAPTLSSGLTPVIDVNGKLSKGSGSTINTVAVGTGQITISHPGNANYLPLDPIVRMVNIVALPVDPEEPMNEVLLTKANMVPRASNPNASKRILGTGGKYFYRFQILWPEFDTPKDLSSFFMKSGYQTGKYVANNRVINYKVWVRLPGSGTNEWTLSAWYDNMTQSGDINRGIPVLNVIQLKEESDGQDLYVRTQVIEASGKDHG